MIKFLNRKYKVEVLKRARKRQGPGVYINEHLTKKDADLPKNGNILRKQGKIQTTWTRNGTVYIRLDEPPEHLRDLDGYKR